MNESDQRLKRRESRAKSLAAENKKKEKERTKSDEFGEAKSHGKGK